MLDRYEFEVLSYLERSRSVVGSIRELADELYISAATVKSSLEMIEASGYAVRENGVYRITEDGLAALEPYRVKRAIVLAAGFGSRMMPATADRPKPMVTVRGTRIIDTLLDALVAVGIRDITIVRGYKKEKLEELKDKYPFLTLIDNDIYESTNNISSAVLALDRLKDGCYFCEADLYISNPGIITKYQYASNILGSYSLETDDWSFRLDNGHICDYRKGNTYCYNYYGISYWTPVDCEKLRDDFQSVWEEPGGRDYFWEFIPLVLRKDRYAVEIRPCRKQDVMEIDTYDELAQLDPTYNTQI